MTMLPTNGVIMEIGKRFNYPWFVSGRDHIWWELTSLVFSVRLFSMTSRNPFSILHETAVRLSGPEKGNSPN